jgi:hypothetical protein
MSEGWADWQSGLPVMTQSISERSKKVVFHPQLLSDFAMVEEIGRKMLKELEQDVLPQGKTGPGGFGRIWKWLRAFESAVLNLRPRDLHFGTVGAASVLSS